MQAGIEVGEYYDLWQKEACQSELRDIEFRRMDGLVDPLPEISSDQRQEITP